MAGTNCFGEIPDLEGCDTQRSITMIQDYLFLLKEQLDYVLRNLGLNNINDHSLIEMKTVFTEDISAELRNEEESLAQLRLDADGLSLSLSNTENQMSALEQTVEGLSLSVRDKSGSISTVELGNGTLDLKNLVFTVLGTGGGTEIHAGNITTGEINAVNIHGVNINGCSITGSTIYTESDSGIVGISDGCINLYQSGRSIVCGSFCYNDMGRVFLGTSAGAVLQIQSDNNLSIAAAANKGIFIGVAANTNQTIEIGTSGAVVRLNGRVLINGREFSGS